MKRPRRDYQRPPLTGRPPELEPEARRNEDADAAIARVSAHAWSARIVGRPERVGHRWQLVVRRDERS